MAQLLIRNIDTGTKHALEIKAAKHGNSLEAEARLILQKAAYAENEPGTLVEAIRVSAQSLGGVELDIPPRTPSRDIDFGW
jgi:plasmid stability protein